MKEWIGKNLIALLTIMSTTIVGLKVDWADIYKTYTSRNERYSESLHKRLESLEEQISLCNSEKQEVMTTLNELKTKFILIEFSTSQFPKWVKDKNSIIIALSDSYEDIVLSKIGVRREQLIGTDGSGFFHDSIVQQWKMNDRDVMYREEEDVYVEYIYKDWGISVKKHIPSKYGGVLGTEGIFLTRKTVSKIVELAEKQKNKKI